MCIGYASMCGQIRRVGDAVAQPLRRRSGSRRLCGEASAYRAFCAPIVEVTGLPGDENAPDAPRFLRTARLEAFSDGVFAIAITLLVLDLAIPKSGRPLDRVLDSWTLYLAYVVMFLTYAA